MTVFSKTVKVKDLNPLTYQPPKGINVNWKLHHSELYATFVASNKNEPQFLREKHDINNALSRLKVIQDTIKDWHTYKNVVPPDPKMQIWRDDGNAMRMVDK